MKSSEQIEKVISKLKFWGCRLTKVQETNLRALLVDIALSSAKETSTSIKNGFTRINEEND